MFHHSDLVRTDVSEECITCIIKVTRIGMFRLPVTANLFPSSPIPVTLIMEAISFSETLVLNKIHME
jgi:hypothetical protein